MSRVILYFLRQPFSLFTACSTRHCGTSACCLRWRWEGSLLCLRVGFNFLYVVPQAGGQRAFLVIFDVVCYVVRTSFGTSFFSWTYRLFVNHRWQSEATDEPKGGWYLLSTKDLFVLCTKFSLRRWASGAAWAADRSGKYFSTPETWTVDYNCKIL